MTLPPVEDGEPIAQLDINDDGEEEYLFRGSGDRSIIITRPDLKYAVTFQFEEYLGFPKISKILNPQKRPSIYLQFEGKASIISYFKNPLYYFKYPFYGLVYLIIYLFITLLYHIQRYRLNLKMEAEKKIASIQMKAIKNQIDPHFTLNILNAIGSLYSDEKNKDKADYIFGKYAKLIRQAVVSSDQIVVTVGEELDFIKNYLEVERFRRNNTFNYTINIGKDINEKTKIPRMLIHTFVENAIKYGIRSRSGGGFLKD